VFTPELAKHTENFNLIVLVENSVQSKKVLECEEGREVKNFLSIARGERIQGLHGD
jgi:hypothetical protein